MKSLLVAMTFVLSASAFATTPATNAVAQLLANGEYLGISGAEKCSVKVSSKDDSVTLVITAKKTTTGYTVVDSTSNYTVNDATGEVSSTEKLTAPHYLQGATKVLNIVANDNNQVEVYISTIATNHRGDDMSSYATCTVSK